MVHIDMSQAAFICIDIYSNYLFFCITKFQYRYVIVCSVLQALQVADVISPPVGWQVIFKTVYNVMCITFVVLLFFDEKS